MSFQDVALSQRANSLPIPRGIKSRNLGAVCVSAWARASFHQTTGLVNHCSLYMHIPRIGVHTRISLDPMWGVHNCDSVFVVTMPQFCCNPKWAFFTVQIYNHVKARLIISFVRSTVLASRKMRVVPFCKAINKLRHNAPIGPPDQGHRRSGRWPLLSCFGVRVFSERCSFSSALSLSKLEEEDLLTKKTNRTTRMKIIDTITSAIVTVQSFSFGINWIDAVSVTFLTPRFDPVSRIAATIYKPVKHRFRARLRAPTWWLLHSRVRQK